MQYNLAYGKDAITNKKESSTVNEDGYLTPVPTDVVSAYPSLDDLYCNGQPNTQDPVNLSTKKTDSHLYSELVI